MDTTWVAIVSLVISTLSLPTIAGLIWKDLYNRKVENSKKNKERKKQELQDNIREVVKDEISPLEQKVDNIANTLKLVEDGTLSTLRSDILKNYYDCVKKRHRNDDDYTNIHKLYQSYKNLNGNSFVKDVIARFDALPTKEEYEEGRGKNRNDYDRSKQ